MSEAKLEETKNWIERQAGNGPYGCLIVRHGSIVAEWYGGSFSIHSLFEIGSIRKSFNSALIGIGIQEGIVDLNTRAADWWPDTFGAFGHGGPRAMFVVPSLDIVVSYNDAHGLNKWVNGPDKPDQDLRSSRFCGRIHLESLRLVSF